MHSSTPEERALNSALLNQPKDFGYRFTHAADCELRRILFRSLARQRDDYLRLFFPQGPPLDYSEPWSLRKAQGALDGAEYTAAAKGTACGHIFKSGESTYHCKTCALDDTCVLCARCFDASDHEGHQVFVSVSPGNSGCCDCGDHEAWKHEVPCTIHTADAALPKQQSTGKDKASAGEPGAGLPVDLVESIRMTISRAVDYLCDVFSCSPEQMRLAKDEEKIKKDEEHSRLSGVYGEESVPEKIEYALILWNDEKHTVFDVQNQVARACSRTKKFGFQKAMEVNDVGRSVVQFSTDLTELLRMAEIIEQLKVTVTIRTSRDTFREHMCEAIIDWIGDISGCSVGNDPYILRNIVCEEFLKPWRAGSQAFNKDIGQKGIDDHETEDNEKLRKNFRNFFRPFQPGVVLRATEPEVGPLPDNDDDDDDEDDYDEDEDEDLMETEEDGMEIELDDIRAAANAAFSATVADVDMEMDFLDDNEGATEALEATFAGYPPPPPPPGAGLRRRIFTPNESDDGEAEPAASNSNEPYGKIPRTPKVKGHIKKPQRPSRHWLEKPDGFRDQRPSEPCEDLWQRVRLDFLILYDLRLWKVLRIHLRHLYITTVVTIPHFKRILGLRFAGLYTALAQLYLIADREPDHSIINLSVQMLTTPTITQEVVERGNFLSNLMAILYTFLTTRQVGFPEDVSPRATLAFDAGAVANRRMFHFFLDLRWLFQSEFIIHRMRVEQRYLLQFLDLVKLHQGVCPNVRATGEHVEYESDAWVSASLIVKEINKLCKQIGLSFEPKPTVFGDDAHLRRAIRTVSQITLINSYGCERKRFHTAEVKNELEWHNIGPFEPEGKLYNVPKSVVQTQPMSFHHPLHYLLSWLIEDAKNMSAEDVRSLLRFSRDELKDPWNATRPQQFSASVTSDDLLSAIFDHPLRVCVWLAQMKAGMWVRNGITLRHQAHTYRSVSHRDVGYQRDILMVQTGFVLSGSESERPGERFLAQVIDRFQMENWIKGDYSVLPGFDETQQIDVFEDFYHLLIIALSERGNLAPSLDSKEQLDRQLQHDIAHALCFKPLSFSDLSSRVTEKISDSDEFNRILETMTNYRPPEGLSDTGTFELKPEFIELVNPYYAHYSRNHREEAESIYKKHMVRKTGKKLEDVVYEPKLHSIPSGLFANLSAFTSTPLFARVVGAALNFAEDARHHNTKLQTTRIETFLHTVLHLVLIATTEDDGHRDGFVKFATSPYSLESSSKSSNRSVVSSLVALSGMDQYASCHPTIRYILRKMQLRLPEKVDTIMGRLAYIFDRTENNSPASISSEDKERKKQEALARQARVMAQMKQQQNSFLQNQGLSGFEDDFDDLDDMSITEEPQSIERRKTWSFPTGTCIWCQEETDDQRLYGTFAFLGESNILRATPVDDMDFIKEVVETPKSLDRPADGIRPFGVAGDNKRVVKKVVPGGKVVESERQGLSKGFPHRDHGSIQGPVATSCGHIMHYSCFELYMENSRRRHQQQIARNHPENPLLNEFTCPLCKALGNTFLPIIWKAKECAHEHELHAAKSLGDWLCDAQADHLAVIARRQEAPSMHGQQQVQVFSTRSSAYVNNMFPPSLVASMNDLSLEASSSTQSPQPRYSLRRGPSLSRFFSWHRNEGSQSSIDTTTLASSGDQVPRMAELMKAYYRIDATLEKNQLASPAVYSPNDPIGALSSSLGLSISAFEIAHRGVGNDVLATSLLADLSEQMLTHLRILSETIESYLAVGVLRPSAPSTVAQETVAKRDCLSFQLFGIPRDSFGEWDNFEGRSLLELDNFLFFVDWLTYTAPSVAEASSAMQLLYWAEIVKTAVVYSKVLQDSPTVLSTVISDKPTTWAFKAAMGAILERADACHDEEAATLRHIVDKYALTFLRKCIVAMYVRYGLDFECPYNVNPESAELERLTSLLHLPSIEDICSLYVSQSEAGSRLQQVTRGWLSQAKHPVLEGMEFAVSTSIRVPHPAIFELVGLPKNYDTLTEEAIKRKCPTTGKELTDPAVCLLCGDIFCSQAVCCMKDKNKGGCYQHMSTCGGKIGVFINIRKCMVLFMHGDANGSYSHAPYLDKHGEPDPTLRRHHQLFLNQKRYDKLIRDAWLQHLIPTVISRKLEADINPGGWETL